MLVQGVGIVSLLVLMSSFSVDAVPGMSNPVLDVFETGCLEDHASDFYKIHERLGLKPISADEEYDRLEMTFEPTELGEYIRKRVEEVQELEHNKQMRTASRSTFQQWMHWDSWSSKVQDWNEEIAKAKDLMSQLGFAFDKVKKRCHKGYDPKFFQKCMMDSIPDGTYPKWTSITSADAQTVRDKLKRRIDIRDIMVHPKFEGSSELWEEAEELKSWLNKMGVVWYDLKSKCSKSMETEADNARERITSELKAGIYEEPEDAEPEDATCTENPAMTCPPGTYVDRQRTRNHVRGGAVMTVMYIAAKVVLAPLGGTIGTVLGGPAGAGAGVMAGSTLGAWMAFAGGYLASLGPKECACFPRQCDFDDDTRLCTMITEDLTPTKNPFPKLLPVAGSKCQLAYKSTDKCVMAACGDTDFRDSHPAEQRIFGKIGRHGTDIFNCLSDNGQPSGSLMLSNTLPGDAADGQIALSRDNTVEGRIALYTKLMGVNDVPDLPVHSSSSTTSTTSVYTGGTTFWTEPSSPVVIT